MLLWDPEDVDGATHEKMMACFKSNAEESADLQEGERYDHFCIIKTKTSRLLQYYSKRTHWSCCHWLMQ